VWPTIEDCWEVARGLPRESTTASTCGDPVPRAGTAEDRAALADHFSADSPPSTAAGPSDLARRAQAFRVWFPERARAGEPDCRAVASTGEECVDAGLPCFAGPSQRAFAGGLPAGFASRISGEIERELIDRALTESELEEGRAPGG